MINSEQKTWDKIGPEFTGKPSKRGGSRPNSGRKPRLRIPYMTRLTPTTIAKIRALAALQGVDDCQIVETHLSTLPRVSEPSSESRPTL